MIWHVSEMKDELIAAEKLAPASLCCKQCPAMDLAEHHGFAPVDQELQDRVMVENADEWP